MKTQTLVIATTELCTLMVGCTGNYGRHRCSLMRNGISSQGVLLLWVSHSVMNEVNGVQNACI